MITKGKLFVCLQVILIAAVIINLNPAMAAEKIDIESLGNMAIVFRGGEKIYVTFHRAKTGALASGLIGAAIVSQMTGPERNDHEKEQQLNGATGNWGFNEIFKEHMMKKIAPKYNKISKTIVYSDDWKFKTVDREFYKHGSSFYRKKEPVYDYTPLTKEGIDSVIEVILEGAYTAQGMLAGRPVPLLEARAKILDIKNKTGLYEKRVFEWGTGKMVHEFPKYLENNGSITKDTFTSLAKTTGTDIGKKLMWRQ